MNKRTQDILAIVLLTVVILVFLSKINNLVSENSNLLIRLEEATEINSTMHEIEMRILNQKIEDMSKYAAVINSGT